MKTQSKFVWRGLAAVLIVLTAMAAMVPAVHAAEINNNGIVKAGETIDDDLMLSGDTVQMDGTVNGMLIATGSTVVINGTVNGDLIAMGQTVIVTENAVVDGNIFTGAQIITIDGKVTGSVAAGSMSVNLGKNTAIDKNLYYGGYSLDLVDGASVGRDVRAGVAQATLSGQVGQDAVVYGDAVEVNGNIGRNAEFIVGNPTSEAMPSGYMPNSGITRYLKPGLRVNPMAVIGGVMNYTSRVNQANQIEAKPAGGIVFHTPEPSEEEKAAAASTPAPVSTAAAIFSSFAGFAGNLISLLLVGGLLLWKFPALLDKNVNTVKTQPWPSTFYGFVTLIVGYAAFLFALPLIILASIIIGFVTIGGLGGVTAAIGLSAWATIFTIFNLLVSHVAKVIVSYLVGKWIFAKLAPANTSNVWPLVTGILIYAVLNAIPLFGLLFSIAATLLGVGAMWLVFKQRNIAAPVAVEA